MGLRQIFLKFDGGNPTGTQKDRIAFAQAMDAMRRGFDAITTATCGNYGVAVALAASLAGLRCIIYIPETYRTKRIQEIINYGSEIIMVPGDYENAVVVSRERAERDEVYDANPGGANTALQLRAYGEIAYEIYDELRDAPAAVAVPVSNGSTMAGIYKGFVSLYRRGKTSRIPRMMAGSSFGKNPIVQAYLKGSPVCEDLSPDLIHETPINEPLINWHSVDGNLALEAIRQTGGWADDVSDKSMLIYARLILEREGLEHPAGLDCGLGGLRGAAPQRAASQRPLCDNSDRQENMSQFPEGNAIVYCEGAFGTPNGKTAHGLVRFTKRYNVLSVIDSCHAGKDAGKMLDGKVQRDSGIWLNR